jgi:hypothetical protein
MPIEKAPTWVAGVVGMDELERGCTKMVFKIEQDLSHRPRDAQRAAFFMDEI